MNEQKWTRWVMQTARCWEDISSVVMRTGIDSIDKDHRQILEYTVEINRVINQLDKDTYNLDLIYRQKELLQDFYEYTEYHFNREEQLIEHYELPGLRNQKLAHRKILAMIADTIADVEAGRITITHQLKMSLLEWVVFHINEIDYNTFQLKNWAPALLKSHSWEDLSEVIRTTGIRVIDQDHRTFTELSLNLFRLLDNKPSPGDPEVSSLFQGMKEFATEHFGREEKVMDEFQLEGAQTHKDLHRQFLQLLSGWSKAFQTNGVVDLEGIKSTLLEWWINHINEVDLSMFSLSHWIQKLMTRCDDWTKVAALLKPTGVAQIDEEHRELVHITLKLDSILHRKDRLDDAAVAARGLEIFQELAEATRQHFTNEEMLLVENNLDDLAGHMGEHLAFLERMDTLVEEFKAGRLAVSHTLKASIIEWWVNHTNERDFKTFESLAPKGESHA